MTADFGDERGREPLEAGKGKETASFLEPSESTQPWHTLTLAK